MNLINHTHVKLPKTFGIFPINQSAQSFLCFLQNYLHSSFRHKVGEKIHRFANIIYIKYPTQCERTVSMSNFNLLVQYRFFFVADLFIVQFMLVGQ